MSVCCSKNIGKFDRRVTCPEVAQTSIDNRPGKDRVSSLHRNYVWVLDRFLDVRFVELEVGKNRQRGS